jgi:antitoxin component YwqK of YwqJK toxin-antitoxin module
MKTKPLTFLLSLTFLFLFSGSVYGKCEPTKDIYRKISSETEKLITKKCSSDLNILKCEFQLRIVKSFVDNLKDRDIDGVVGQVSFPFAFFDKGKEIAVIDNSEQFRKYYDHIFPDHVVKNLVEYPLGRQWSNWKGITLPRGELWFHEDSGKLKTINAYDEELIKKMADDIRKNNKEHRKNGKRDGLVTWCWKNGKKKMETLWKNGKKVRATFWKESGEMKYIKEYDKDGHFMSQRDFVDGIEVINPY